MCWISIKTDIQVFFASAEINKTRNLNRKPQNPSLLLPMKDRLSTHYNWRWAHPNQLNQLIHRFAVIQSTSIFHFARLPTAATNRSTKISKLESSVNNVCVATADSSHASFCASVVIAWNEITLSAFHLPIKNHLILSIWSQGKCETVAGILPQLLRFDVTDEKKIALTFKSVFDIYVVCRRAAIKCVFRARIATIRRFYDPCLCLVFICCILYLFNVSCATKK